MGFFDKFKKKEVPVVVEVIEPEVEAIMAEEVKQEVVEVQELDSVEQKNVEKAEALGESHSDRLPVFDTPSIDGPTHDYLGKKLKK